MNKTFKKNTIEFRHLFYLDAFFFNLPIHSFCKGDILQTKKIRSHWSSHIITYWSACSNPEVSFLLKLSLDPLTEHGHTKQSFPEGCTGEPINRESIPSKMQPKQGFFACGRANCSSAALLCSKSIFHFTV